MHNKITRREFALRVAALAAGAATGSFRTVNAGQAVNPSVEKTTANLILQNGRITTLDPKHPEAKEVIIADGRIAGVDNARDFQSVPETKVIDLRGRRVIPGLYDSHRERLALSRVLQRLRLPNASTGAWLPAERGSSSFRALRSPRPRD
jgi:hypothetical protein